MWFVYTSETRVSLMHSQLYTVVYILVFSLTSQTLSIPQHQSLLVSVHKLHAESNRHSGTEKVWLARLACVSAWSNNKLLVYMTIQLTSHTNGGIYYLLQVLNFHWKQYSSNAPGLGGVLVS